MGEEADDMIDRAMLYDDDINEGVGCVVEGHQKRDSLGPIETEKAVLWVLLDGTEVWLPRSQIIRQNVSDIVITDWLADKKGWVEEIINRDPNAKQKETPISDYTTDDDIPF